MTSTSPLNLGGNVFGWTADATATYAVLDGFLDGGGNFIDTADSYSAWVPGHRGGESESLIGEWLRGRRRDDVVIATKVSQHPELSGLSAATIAKAADASLERLGTEHIDLYYAHFDDGTPMEEIVGALSALVDVGKVRHSRGPTRTRRCAPWAATSPPGWGRPGCAASSGAPPRVWTARSPASSASSS